MPKYARTFAAHLSWNFEIGKDMFDIPFFDCNRKIWRFIFCPTLTMTHAFDEYKNTPVWTHSIWILCEHYYFCSKWTSLLKFPHLGVLKKKVVVIVNSWHSVTGALYILLKIQYVPANSQPKISKLYIFTCLCHEAYKLGQYYLK